MIELILEESELRRPFGSWEVQREQLRSLAQDARTGTMSACKYCRWIAGCEEHTPVTVAPCSWW